MLKVNSTYRMIDGDTCYIIDIITKPTGTQVVYDSQYMESLGEKECVMSYNSFVDGVLREEGVLGQAEIKTV